MASNQLSSAIARLQNDYKEILKSPIQGVSAIPLEDNIFEWHCNIQYMDTFYHIILTFPESYPAKSPSAEFMPSFSFDRGATRQGANGGTRICLNIFSDFAEIHTEWANDKSGGWSVAYTTQIVLLNLMSFLQESSSGSYFSYGKGQSEENAKLAKSYICKKCPHKPDAIFPPMPSDFPAPAATTSASPLDAISCYVTKQSFKSAPPREIWGFGVVVSGKAPNFNLTSPCEWISLSAFDTLQKTSNRVESVFRETLSYFLPLYLSEEHWKNAKAEFQNRICQAAKSRNTEDAIFQVLPKLLNSSVVAYMNSQNAHVSENALNGYFLFVQLFEQAVQMFPKLRQRIEDAITNFVKNPASRMKKVTPNIGELLALLVVSQQSWETLSASYLEENLLRNVMWYTKNKPELLNANTAQSDRLSKTFAETRVSRDLAVFQVSFLKALKLEKENKSGFPTAPQQEYLLKVVKSLKTMKNFAEWFEILGLPYPGDQAFAKDLLNSVQKSQKLEGYYFSNNNNNRYRGGGGNRRGNRY